MREHLIYYFTDDDGENYGNDCYYLRDARRYAAKLAKEYKRDIFINQGDDIVDVAFYCED